MGEGAGWRYTSNLPHTSTHSQLHIYPFPSQSHMLTPIIFPLRHMGHADFCTGPHNFRMSVCLLYITHILPIQALIHRDHGLSPGCSTYTCPIPKMTRCAFFPAYTPDSTTLHSVTPTPLYMGLSSHTASLVPRDVP